MNFRQALRNRDMDQLRRVPKSDLHNHFVLGGNREYIRRTTGVRIDPIVIPLTSMDEIHQWNNETLAADQEFRADLPHGKGKRVGLEGTYRGMGNG